MEYLEAQVWPEPELINVMNHVLRPGDIFIDGGANIGFFSILASFIVGPAGRVEAYEPSSSSFEKLKKNVALNNKNIDILKRALLDDCHSSFIFLHKDDPGQNSLWEESDEKEPILTIGLDDTSAKHAKLIKLDIEGAEFRTLSGSVETLKCPFIVCELNLEAMERAGVSQAQLRGFMRDLGYETFLLPAEGMPMLVPPKTAILPRFVSANIMFSTIEAVQEVWRVVNI